MGSFSYRKLGDSTIVVEARGFGFEITPYLAIRGELARPLKVLPREQGFSLEFEGGTGFLKLAEASPGSLLIEASAEGGYSRSGALARLDCRVSGFERVLLYHFTYDPDMYFGEVDEPYPYPRFREAGEEQYCPWSYPVHAPGFSGLPANLKISQLLLKGRDGYVFLLPASDAGARGYITRPGDGFSVVLNRMVGGEWSRVLLLALSASGSPYEAVERAYEACLGALGKPQVLRRNKILPDVFRYLGWCSWNAMWREPTDEKIVATVEGLLRAGVKPGFMLVDDGWQDEEPKTGFGASRMRSLEPNPAKFPRGFGPMIKDLKERGVKYVGLWHTLNVHWAGVARGSRLAEEFKDYLIDSGDMLLPDPRRAFDMFREWYRRLKTWGFDFVKVDNQSFVAYGYRGRIPVEDAARQLHEGLEGAAYVHALDVLNCMAQQPENQFNWLRSAVARACVDYIVPHKKSRNKLHLYFNAYNSLWMSQLVWPDWDMFQSHDPWALQQAVARAVSGGPVYTTDDAGRARPEIVRPLAFSDARLPLPDHPAMPTEDVLMRDPYNEPVPLKVFTRVRVDGLGLYGIVAAFNVNRDDRVVSGAIGPSDALLSEGDYLAYEYFTGRAAPVRAGEKLSFEVEPMGVRLYILSPLEDEVSPIGLRDVYIMPRGIVRGFRVGGSLSLELYEPGTLVVWTPRTLQVEGGEARREGDIHTVKCSGRVVRLEPG